MKKYFAMLMTLCVLLTGCTTQEKKTETPKIAENQAEEVVVPEEIVSETEETTAPTQSEETPEAPEEPEEPAPEEPATPVESTPVESAPAQPSTPVQNTPAQPTTPVQNTTPQQPTNHRPTSRSTSKDTGSNKKWDYPEVHKWEETDPQRTSYINSNTNTTYPTSLSGNGGVLMFVGHTYGMKFLHDGDASDLRWYSSDASVATVNQVGFVTPLKQGVTEIGFYFDGQRYKRTVYVFLEPDFTEAQLEQMAKEEAKRIAEYVMSLPVNTDLERIGAAALIINRFVALGHTIPSYTINEDGSISCNVVGYNRPFGTFITGYSTCAGNVRALGMILEYMGFEWYHVNANQWDHQWCVVYDVDGQTAFADGAYLGIVGYGERQEDSSNWKQYNRPIEYNIQTVL